jgi:hypothetical protein
VRQPVNALPPGSQCAEGAGNAFGPLKSSSYFVGTSAGSGDFLGKKSRKKTLFIRAVLVSLPSADRAEGRFSCPWRFWDYGVQLAAS